MRTATPRRSATARTDVVAAAKSLDPPPRSLDDPERDDVVAALFDTHYASMMRLAVRLGADDPENIVAEAFYQLCRGWRRLREPGAAEAYLRSIVCNLTRMRIRHLQVARRYLQTAWDEAEQPTHLITSAEMMMLVGEDHRALIGALRSLPARQREALVLRYWLGLKEREIADSMGISVGSIKTHTSRSLAALTQAMGKHA